MEKAGEARGRSVFRQPARGHRDRASVCVVDLKAEIDKLATEYMSSARSLSSEEKLALLKQIQEAYGKCKEFGDDKVQLAMQTYEMVGPVPGSSPSFHLILGVLAPSYHGLANCWGRGSGRAVKSALASPYFTRTSQ